MTSLEIMLKLHRLTLGGRYSCSPRDRSPAGGGGGVLVGPGELLARHVDLHLPARLLLDVVQHDEGVGHHPRGSGPSGSDRPDDLQPRVAVDRRPVLAAPARPHPKLPARVEDHRHDEHEDRHRGDDQHVVERRRSRAPGLEACTGNQWIPRSRGRCRSPWRSRRRGWFAPASGRGIDGGLSQPEGRDWGGRASTAVILFARPAERRRRTGRGRGDRRPASSAAARAGRAHGGAFRGDPGLTRAR